MMTSAERRRTRLSIEIEPELRRALDEEQDNALAVNRAWAQLSVRSFARDWNSDEDQVYDHLS